MRARRAAIASLTLAAALGVSGCSAGRPPLGVGSGSANVCFRALPVARRAIHEPRARLVGLQRLPADQLERHLSPANVAVIENDATVCAFAFHGSFTPGQVTDAAPTQSGAYAIVLVTSKRLHLVHAFVTDRLPRHFRHPFA